MNPQTIWRGPVGDGWDERRDLPRELVQRTSRVRAWFHEKRGISVLITLENHGAAGTWLHFSAARIVGDVQLAPSDEDWGFARCAFRAHGDEDNRDSIGRARHLWRRIVTKPRVKRGHP